MKDSADVVSEFGELVNMTAQELREWLKSEDSTSAGWAGDKTDGESVGHESGRRIIEILEANPGMEPGKYTEEHIQHMRKVVSYCKRHLAQEERSNNEKPIEEVEKTKSFASLKNWGHDCIKAREEKKKNKGGKKGNDEGPAEGKATAKGQKAGDKREAAVVIEDDEDEEEEEEDKKGDKKAGKKRKTEKEEQVEEEEEEGDEDFVGDEEEDENDEGEDEGEGEGEDEKKKGAQKGGSKGKGPQKGETVSWNWAGGQPEGKVLDVKGEETSIQTKRGNEVTRKGNPDDPAVVLDTGKSQALKLDHELND